MEEIEEQDYQITISHLIQYKSSLIDESDIFVKRSKIAKFLIGKGFEPSVIWPTIKEEIPDK